MAEDKKYGSTGPRPLYAVTIHHTIAGGDLAKMKALADEGDKFLADIGNLSGALADLKSEIRKREAKK